MLKRESEPNMYGDEELSLPPDELYVEEDARMSSESSEFVFENCKKLFEEAKEYKHKKI